MIYLKELKPKDFGFGVWTPWKDCPVATYASGFQIRMEAPQGCCSHDDTALNSIQIQCESISGTKSE